MKYVAILSVFCIILLTSCNREDLKVAEKELSKDIQRGLKEIQEEEEAMDKSIAVENLPSKVEKSYTSTISDKTLKAIAICRGRVMKKEKDYFCDRNSHLCGRGKMCESVGHKPSQVALHNIIVDSLLYNRTDQKVKKLYRDIRTEYRTHPLEEGDTVYFVIWHYAPGGTHILDVRTEKELTLTK